MGEIFLLRSSCSLDKAEVPFHVVHLTLKQSRKSDNLMAGLDFKQWLQFNYEFRGGTTKCFSLQLLEFLKMHSNYFYNSLMST